MAFEPVPANPPVPANLHGRFEPFLCDDEVSGVVIDGRLDHALDERVVGEGRLTMKVQLAGAGQYYFDGAPASAVVGEGLVIAHQPTGVIKRQVIAGDTEERSVTLYFPRLSDGRIAGFEGESHEVRAASDFLTERLLFRSYQAPRAALHCAGAILDLRRSPWAQERFKRAKIDELTCLLLDFFFSQFKQAHDHGLTEREVRRVQQVREIITARFDAPPGIAELARAVGLNRTRLNAAFRAFYGRTISQVLQQERMENARALLIADGLSVSEIAERCGYGHLSNFSLAYKAYFGMSPSAARDGPGQILPSA